MTLPVQVQISLRHRRGRGCSFGAHLDLSSRKKEVGRHAHTNMADEFTDVLVIEDIRTRLRGNRTALLGLFQNGRTVQPTDNVIRFMAPLVLEHPIEPRDVALLGEILDPNNTKFVVLKRARDLAGSDPVSSTSSALALVSSSKEQQQLALPPPKRAPPSAAVQLLGKQAKHQDPDKVAIMMALTWSGKHLSSGAVSKFGSQPPVEIPPLSRFIVRLDPEQIAYQYQDQDLSAMYHCLAKQVYDSRDRGKVCLALVASHVLSEVALRVNMLGRSENAGLVQAIVPEGLLHSFLSTHRMHRLQVLTDKSHESFLRLTPVRLPLVLTTLRVEMESATRQVSAFVLSYSHSGRLVLPVWLAMTEKQRAAFATSLFELHVWDDELWRVLCSDEDGDCDPLLEVLLLPKQLQLGNGEEGGYTSVWEGKTEIQVRLDALLGEMVEIEQMAHQPSASLTALEDLGEEAMDMDADIFALKTKVEHICSELWL
ncbi:hypothetical protein BASA81_001973 [Batrachochytrium salamandrivorans]|nr:hypothetical protein BASA81_001973 [Batrachochytrium salamandrivorans]